MSAIKQFKNSVGSKDLKNFLMKEKSKTKENDGIIIDNLEEINDTSFSKGKNKNNNEKNETISETDSNSDQKNMKYNISSLDLMKLLKKEKSKTKNNEEEKTEQNENSKNSEFNSEDNSEKNNDQKNMKYSINSLDLMKLLKKEKSKTKNNEEEDFEISINFNESKESENKSDKDNEEEKSKKNMKYTISSLDLMKLLKMEKLKNNNNEEEKLNNIENKKDSKEKLEKNDSLNDDIKNIFDLMKYLKKEKSKTKVKEEENDNHNNDNNENENESESENKNEMDDDLENLNEEISNKEKDDDEKYDKSNIKKNSMKYTINSLDLMKYLKKEKTKDSINEKEKYDTNDGKKDNKEKLGKYDNTMEDLMEMFDIIKYLKKEKSKSKVKEEEEKSDDDEMDNYLKNLEEEINNKEKDDDEKSNKSSKKKSSMKYTMNSLDLMKYLKKEKTKDSINEEGKSDTNDGKKDNKEKLGKYDNTMEDLMEMFDIIKYLKKEKSKSKIKEEDEEGNDDDDEIDNYLKNLKEDINNKEKDDDEKSNKSSKKKSSMKYSMNSLDLKKYLKKEKAKDSINEEEKSDTNDDKKNNKEKPEKSDGSKDEMKDLLDLMKYLKKEKSKTKNKEEEQEENPENNNNSNNNNGKSEKSDTKYSINSLDLMKLMKKEKTKDSIHKNENNNEINNNKKNNKDKTTKDDEKTDNKGKSNKDDEKKDNKNKSFKDDEKKKNKNKTSTNDEKKDNNSKIFKNNDKMDNNEKPEKNDNPMEELMYKLDLIRYLKKEKSKTTKMKKEVKVEESIKNNNDLKSTKEKIENQKSMKYTINSLDLMKLLKKEKSKSKVNEEIKNETDKKNNNKNNKNNNINNNKENPEKNENPLDDLMELLEQNIDLEDFRKKMEKLNNYTGLNFLYNYYYYDKPEVVDIERRNGLKGIEEKIVKANDSKTIKEKIRLIKHLINGHLIKTVDDIKVFLKENEITIKELNSLKGFDLLIYLIEGQTGYITIPLIKHIVSFTYYKNLNYTIFSNKFGVRSPLLSAIVNKNYRVADFLIKRGADINYKINSINILYYLLNNHLLNKSTLKYLINNGYDVAVMDSFIINNLSNDYINIIFNYGIFDNSFVLRMLHGYKNQIPLSDAHIRFLVEREKKKIKIQNDWYFEAFSKSDYTKIDILFTNEIIPNENKINDIIYKIFSIVDIYDMKNHTDKKYEFREAIENKELKQLQKMSKEFLDDVSLPNIEHKRNMVKEIIKEDNFERLNEYVKRNNIMTKDLNDEHFDMLIYAIENGVSLDNIFEIIKLAQYHVFDYKLMDDESKDFKTPFLVAISNRRYDVVDFLINNEVNIHKHLITIVDDKPCNDLINYLCRNKKLNYQSLIFIFSKLDNGKEDFYVDPESFNYLIESSKNKEAEILIDKFSLPIVDDWYKKAAEVENFGFIDMAFEHDTREFNKKSEILQTILAENLHPMKIAEFMKYTKHTKIRDIYRETMISIFQGEFGKLLS